MYELTETPSEDGELYGVRWIAGNRSICYDAITDNKDELQQLVLLYTRLQLDTNQLEDVLDDFLTDFHV